TLAGLSTETSESLVSSAMCLCYYSPGKFPGSHGQLIVSVCGREGWNICFRACAVTESHQVCKAGLAVRHDDIALVLRNYLDDCSGVVYRVSVNKTIDHLLIGDTICL